MTATIIPSPAEEPRRSAGASIIARYRRRRSIGDAFVARRQALAEPSRETTPTGRHHVEPPTVVMPPVAAWPTEDEVPAVPEWTVPDRIRKGHLDVVERACLAAVMTEYLALTDTRGLPTGLVVALEQVRAQFELRRHAATAVAPIAERSEIA